MKHLKYFESKTELQVGDYIIANFEFSYNPLWSEYISNNIGKTIRVGEKTYKEYLKGTDAIPGIHAKYFISDEIYKAIEHKRLVKKNKNGDKYMIMKFNPEDIVGFSKDKNAVEAILAAKKYNL